MTLGDEDRSAALRRGVYALLIALTVGEATGRLLAVNTVQRIDHERAEINRRVQSLERRLQAEGLASDEVARRIAADRPQIEAESRRQFPLLGANDRSRWLAIRALVDQGTFAIDDVLDEHRWTTIDMVRHRGRDGELHLYSSKPPLVTVLLAGVYWIIKSVAGWTLAENPYEVVRLMLWLVNVVSLGLLVALVARWAERYGRTDWGRFLVVATAAAGTLLKPFVVVLNNHLLGAVTAALAFDAVLRIVCEGDRRGRWFLAAGFFAALTAAEELPALALLAAAAAGLAAIDMKKCCAWFLPAAAVVAAAFFGVNYAAHGSLRPPYAHRSATVAEDNWYDYSYEVAGKSRDSYWRNPQGVDRGEASRAVYALHVLAGHHGVFSLTPVWLLSAWGLWLWGRDEDNRLRAIAAAIAAISLACLAFYVLLRPQSDRNYGGMCCGFRWLLWLAPLWLAAMLPAADRLARTAGGRATGLVLLALSALSASYPTWNPWTPPWIQNAMQWLEWVQPL
jgi:hypothetical protein